MTHQSTPTQKAFLTLREAAEYANCSTVTLRRAIRARQLAHHRFGFSETRGKIFVKVSDLQGFIDGHRIAASI
jgi:excisionase family DNA binding protein